MARGRQRQDGEDGQPHEIRPTALYFERDLIAHLRFGKDGFRRLVRQGRLRAALPRGELCTLGEWLLEWIRANEVKKDADGRAAA